MTVTVFVYGLCVTFKTCVRPGIFFAQSRSRRDQQGKGERLAFPPLQLDGSGALVFFTVALSIFVCLFVYPLTHLFFHTARPPCGFACFCTGIVAFNNRALIQSICRGVSIKCVLNNAACGRRERCSLLTDVTVTPLVFPFVVVVLFYVLLRLHP